MESPYQDRTDITDGCLLTLGVLLFATVLFWGYFFNQEKVNGFISELFTNFFKY